MTRNNNKIYILLYAILCVMTITILVGAIFGLYKNYFNDKDLYDFRYGYASNMPDMSVSSRQNINYADHSGIVSGLIPVEGLNLSLDEDSGVLCVVYCYDENKVYGGSGISCEEGKTFITFGFGGSIKYDSTLLPTGTKYVRLMLQYSDSREIPENEFDKVLSALTISYDIK